MVLHSTSSQNICGYTSHHCWKKVLWHYTATSHGKGGVDGIGGTVKRAVHSAIMAHKYNVCDAQGYANCARHVTQRINILYVDTSDIDSLKPELTEMWNSAVTLKGTHGVHCVQAVAFGVVSTSRYSEKKGDVHRLLPEVVHQETDTNLDNDTNRPDEVNSDSDSTGDDSTGDDNTDNHSGLTIIPGHWYAVNWKPTSYWYIGRAVEEAEGDI